MKLHLAYYDDSILRKQAAKIENIDDHLHQLVNAMFEMMHATNGIGLAAPQVHHSIALFVSCVPVQKADGKWVQGQNLVFINPQVLEVSKETQINSEGCLSIPNLYVKVERPASVKIQAMNLKGETF